MLLLPNLITLNEKVNFTHQTSFAGTDHCSWNSSFTISVKAPKPFILNRNAADDTFNVEIPQVLLLNDSSYADLPYLSINNELELAGPNSPMAKTLFRNGETGDTWRFHHSLLKDSKFRKLSTLALGEDFAYNTDSPLPAIRRVAFPQFEEISKNVSTTFENLVEIKSIKRIVLNNLQADYAKVSWGGGNQSFKPENRKIGDNEQVEFFYDHFFVKPIEPNLYSNSEDVAEIYGYSETNEDLGIADLSVKNAKLKTSSLKANDLTLAFEKTSGPKVFLQEGEKPYLLGKLKITDPTYYDYKTQETKIGFSANSSIGEQVPFNFKGNYTRQINFDLNEVYKDMHIAFSKEINQPILGQSNGIVQLKVEEIEPPKQLHYVYFEPEDIKQIKENNYDLIGIMRLSHE